MKEMDNYKAAGTDIESPPLKRRKTKEEEMEEEELKALPSASVKNCTVNGAVQNDYESLSLSHGCAHSTFINGESRCHSFPRLSTPPVNPIVTSL